MLWLWLALVAITVVAYQPAWHGTMLWDDDAHLTRPDLRSVEGLWRIWFDLGATQQYYPLVHSLFWLQARLWGDNPLGYHLVSLGLHGTSAFVLVLILRRLAIPGAVLAGVIFALHPVHVESVAWMTELKNTLSGTFYLGAALAYLQFDRLRQGRFYGRALALFVLALLSKTVAATLPAALLVVFWWQRGRLGWRRDVVPLVPLFALGAAGGLTTAWVERTFVGATGADFTLSLIERGLIAGRAVAFYLGRLIWPADLMFIYPRWEVSDTVWGQYLYPLGVAGLLLGLWHLRRWSRAPLAALLLFCVTLAPALGFVDIYPFRFSFVADHFQYLASIGIIALGAGTLTVVLRQFTVASTTWGRVAVAVAVGVPLALVTRSESRQYIDAETLYRSTLGRNPSSWLAHLNLGVIESTRPTPNFPAAIEQFEAALKLSPNEPRIHANLGTAWERMGRYQQALDAHLTAVRLAPTQVEPRVNVAVDLQYLGRFDEAAAAYAEVLRLAPDLTAAHFNRALVLLELGRDEEAIAHLREAIRLDPQKADARKVLDDVTVGRAGAVARRAAALAAAGRFAEAAGQYELAVRLSPESARLRVGLGDALWRAGRLDDAEAELRLALKLPPDDPVAYDTLGNVLQATGRFEEAEKMYRQALALPTGAGRAEIHNDLGVALARQGRQTEAVAKFREALRLKPDFAPAKANLARALKLAR